MKDTVTVRLNGARSKCTSLDIKSKQKDANCTCSTQFTPDVTARAIIKGLSQSSQRVQEALKPSLDTDIMDTCCLLNMKCS